jgi:hypothetical protein
VTIPGREPTPSRRPVGHHAGAVVELGAGLEHKNGWTRHLGDRELYLPQSWAEDRSAMRFM